MAQVKRNHSPKKNYYSNFYLINGKHPFKEKVINGRVEYNVRRKKGGKVAYFNFDLAKEMGLIPENHLDLLNDELEKVILNTFSLVIINEYDIEHKIKIPDEEILPQTYMATRYLQLQHPDKKGRTSGDGRSIWNGFFKGKTCYWDISSCGTGATRLSPACNINKKFYKTGDPAVSYGCGLSDVSEGLETLFFSEVFAKNKIKTERILAIIEFEKGLAINVRAYPNLIRPSHFFSHLKQSNYETLKQVADCYIEREILNKKWEKTIFHSDKEKYYYLAKKVATDFARVAALFEDEYIFCWLDWDGDNILTDGGIIDYGSIRQFGLFHSEYRFDDVERFSTKITEQKNKAKYIAQCFIQIADFLATKKKKQLRFFDKNKILEEFENEFEHAKNLNILRKIGFQEEYVQYLIESNLDDLKEFRAIFSYFERKQSKRSCYKVADGINRDTIFCMRDVLREIPQLFLASEHRLSTKEFFEIAKSSYARKTDLKVTAKNDHFVEKFQEKYLSLVESVSKKYAVKRDKILLDLTMRSSVINKYDRVTGDSITFMIEKVMKKKRDLSPTDLFQLSKDFSSYQNFNPDLKVERISKNSPTHQKKIINSFLHIVRTCREGL